MTPQLTLAIGIALLLIGAPAVAFVLSWLLLSQQRHRSGGRSVPPPENRPRRSIPGRGV